MFKKELIKNIVISELKHSLKLKNINNIWDIYCKEKEKKIEELDLLTKDLYGKTEYLDSLIKNIKIMFKDLTDKDLKEYVKIDAKEKSNKEKLEGCLRSDLAGHLIYQETLLSKVKSQYHKEKETKKEEFNRKYINSKAEFEKVLSNFIVDINKLDTRRKRILIDLVVDKIIVNLLDGLPSVQIVINPSEVIG
ncbi:hypothetical protein [Clostridium magnum]|uniref:Uncharacterized protein n=1 Tax=Clostridium magnum DSM 2767 TaxID=1121326 RepID=A0A162U6L1_9CLOT|nr:hypothetical protein [Clostridium magnum]KZL93594.1 hypothetical protein CLMAG_06400 [Clostridium magnum DSM 2767]SHI58723.1 hypothetical protein SAMN02745944_04536 [Clostridium magnum DSM 2767]